ncbi:MAG: hypothetical protein WCA58_13495 [Terriglobales bacterium]
MTFAKVATPATAKTPLPTKFAVAEKHTVRFSVARVKDYEDYTDRQRTQSIFAADILWGRHNAQNRVV